MRKVLEAFNYDVKSIFNVPDEDEGGADYIKYLQSTKQYKELVNLLKKYHIESDSVRKVNIVSGHFSARFKTPNGIINMDDTGYTFTPNKSITFLDDEGLEKYAKVFSDVKTFCDAVMKLNLEDMNSYTEY